MSISKRFMTLLIIGVGALLLPLLSVTAASTNRQGKEVAPVTNSSLGEQPTLLNLNIRHNGQDPSTLDPSLLLSVPAAEVVEQLFIGLVDIDDENGAIQPELATSWTVSPDKTIYTFSLRSDVYWTDGNPVTAQDVHYGILRTLEQPVGTGLAYALYPIKNAEAYNVGSITDPNQVGVQVVNDITLQIELEQPAAQILSILGMWIARPLPQWTIEAHGDAWTEPENIVTNGAYQLTEWIPNDHVLLSKNPSFYLADDVQIDQVKMWMLDEATAWQMYLDGQLDTAEVPLSATLDPVTSQGIHTDYSSCISYYGFNVARPPFDNVLVRKALIAATDRSLLAVGTLGRSRQPAHTFTPPGMFGHNEAAGIPYDPSQAQEWLSKAGFPGGQNLPSLTLTISTSSSQEYIAETLINHWYERLGVSVTLEVLPIQDYIDRLFNGELQIWRNGWCSDYPDAYNYLAEGVFPPAFGNWTNLTYTSLLEQATQEDNLSNRNALLQQAEAILVEEDAVMLPLYHHASSVATKAYLQRTYPVFHPDIATWTLNQVSATIDTSGGSLTSHDGTFSINVPGGTFTDTVTLTVRPAYGMLPSNNLINTDLTYEIFANFSDTGQPAQPASGEVIELTIQYSDDGIGPAIEDTLALYYWSDGQWHQEPTSMLNLATNVITATPDHLSLWAVLGETNRLFLPAVER